VFTAQLLTLRFFEPWFLSYFRTRLFPFELSVMAPYICEHLLFTAD